MYIMESIMLEMGIEADDAFADGASMFEDGASEAEVRAYLEECFGVPKNNTDKEF